MATRIKNLAPEFLKHVYIKREQSLVYIKEVEAAVSPSFNPNIGIIQVVFAENYTCSLAAKSISVFTASMWYTACQHSYALVSDSLTHSKETVISYSLLEQLSSEVQDVRIWSVGSSNQFMNRNITAALNVFKKHNDKYMIWNYFATSHGKGPVDGIGGSIKRTVRNAF